MNLEPFLLKFEAKHRVKLPRSDVLYVIADLIEALVSEGLANTGVAKLAAGMADTNAQARQDRLTIVSDLRGVQSELRQLRLAVEKLQANFDQITIEEEPQTKPNWFARLLGG